MTRPARDRRGFALPAVILLVALLTILLTSGLNRARAERQIARASDETASALTVAQSGLQTYYGTVTTRPADGDSTRINVTGGYAHVITHLVRRPADTTERTLYLVRSTGFAITPDSGAVPMARRTVAQFAVWEISRIERLAALTAASGLRHRNNNPNPSRLEISGVDQCGAAPPVLGLRTTQFNLVGPPGPDTSIVGSPAGVLESGSSGFAAREAIVTQSRIDWAGTIGDGLIPDYASFQNGDTTYSIQRVPGSLTLAGTTTGTGLLVVPSDLTITGASFTFDGILLVGGAIRFEADVNVIRGLVVSGLNPAWNQSSQAGGTPGENRRDVFLYYNSCTVQTALARVAGFTPVRNAWLDTWATY
jgi:type II secretory pathway pseudopilin PulG